MGKRKFTTLLTIAAASLLTLPTMAQSPKMSKEDVMKMVLSQKHTAKGDAELQKRQSSFIARTQSLVSGKREQKADAKTISSVIPTTPVGPRKNVTLKRQANGGALLTVGSTNILLNNVEWETMGDGESPRIELMNTADATNPEILYEDVYFAGYNGGGLEDNIYYGGELASFFGYYFSYINFVDLETGTDDYYDCDFSLIGLYDTAVAPDGTTYGVFYNAAGSGLEFGAIDYASQSRSTIKAYGNDYVMPMAFGITSDYVGYAIGIDANLYKVDLATGEFTLVGATGMPTLNMYQTGEIDQKTNTFYWIYASQTEELLCTVDLNTGAATVVCDLGYNTYVDAMIMKPAAEDGAPAAIEDVAIDFANGALTGTVSFTMPTTTFAGEAITGALDYTIKVNNVEVKKGTAEAGQKVVEELTLEQGQNNIQVFTANAVGSSPKSNKLNSWIGFDTPAAPQNVAFDYVDGVFSVKWDAVTAGIHEGFVGDITYNVYRVVSGETTQIAAGIAETALTDEYTVIGLQPVQYVVEATNGIETSEAGQSAISAVGSSLEVPYFADFSDPLTFNYFTVIDANNDGRTWGYNTTGGYAYYTYNSSSNGDDWLITAPIKAVAGKTYTVTVNAAAQSEVYGPERMEVKWGTSINALNGTVIAATDVAPITFEDYEGTFTAEADGDVYVGIHAISEPDMYYLKVASFTVEAEAGPTAPRAPRLAVQPDPYGAEKAVVTVTAPARTKEGVKIEGNLSKIDIFRDNKVIKTYTNVKPEAINVFVDEVATGAHTYMALPYDAAGDAGQRTEKQKVFVGLDVPAPVDNIVAYEQANGSVRVTWDPVTAGANGGLVVPGEVEYVVWNSVIENNRVYLNEKVDSTFATETTIGFNPTAEQELYSLYIQPRNDAGAGSAYGVSFFIGAPYQLPIEEHFSGNGGYSTWLYGVSDPNLVTLAASADASDNDGSAYVFSSTADNQVAYLTMGKVKLGQGNPTLIVDIKGDGSTKNVFKVQAETINGTRKDVASFIPTDEYQSYKVSLSDYADEPFIKFYLYFDFKEHGSMTVDNIQALDLLEYNLTAGITAPKSIEAGKTAVIDVVVKNRGENPAAGYVVKLFADDDQLLSVNETEALASFTEKHFTAELPTSIFDEEKDITLSAEIAYENDLDDEDNVAEAVITIKQSAAATPNNVKAQRTAEGVQLTWSEPNNSIEEVTESFEDQEVFVPFGLGGITADNHYGAFGDWTVYDGNGSAVYTFQNASYENTGEPSAFMPFNPTIASEFSTGYAATTGEQFLWSICPEDGSQTDHWLISPELPGVAQTISFMDRVITDQYGNETFEVLVSTTDNKVESFTKVADFSTASTEWEETTVELPAGAKYFAIRHTSTDVFGLLIDDVKFSVNGGTLAKYNIYVDGQDGVYDDTTETSYLVKNAANAKWAAVSAVYQSGKESRPVVVTFSAAQEITSIAELTGNNEPVDVYSVDGKLVRQQTTKLDGLKGAYVINGQKVIVK